MGRGGARRPGRGGGALDTTGGTPEDRRGGDGPGSTARRVLWFGALWLAGVATVSLVAWVVRSVLVP